MDDVKGAGTVSSSGGWCPFGLADGGTNNGN